MKLYSKNIDFFLDTKNIDDPGMKLHVNPLSSVGTSTYKLMKNLLSPVLPKPEYIMKFCRCSRITIYRPKPAISVERYNFHFRVFQPSATEFCSQIHSNHHFRELSGFCEFVQYLDGIMLRDRLVCGINNAQIQKLLLSEKDLTFRSTKIS